MNDSHQIALLIDADNTQPPMMDAIMARLLPLGNIPIRRAFANWRKDALKPWLDITMRHAIKAEQQFDYVKGKNATDMALTIAAMDLLHSGRFDSFAIVSSDSDFTPLALRLREAGVRVIGIGRENTPEAFRSCCDPFISLESLAPPRPAPAARPAASQPAPQPAAPAPARKAAGKASAANKPSLEELHETLRRLAAEQGEAGFLDTGTAGSLLQQLYPGFKIRQYGGRATLTTFCGLFPELYAVKKGKGKGAKAYYRCLADEPAPEAGPDAAPEAPESPEAAEAAAAPELPDAPELTDAHAALPPAPEPEALVLSPVDGQLEHMLQAFTEAHNALASSPDVFLMLNKASAHLRKSDPAFSLKSLGYEGPKAFLASFPEAFELRADNRAYRLR